MGALAELIKYDEERKKTPVDKPMGMLETTALVGKIDQAMEQGFNLMVAAIREVVERLDTSEQRISSAVDNKHIPPDSNPAIAQASSEIKELRAELQSIVSAVSAIKLPDMPKFPNIPESKQVDYGRIQRMIDTAIQGIPELPEAVTAPKREFDFDVIRNNFGSIDKVKVVEQ